MYRNFQWDAVAAIAVGVGAAAAVSIHAAVRGPQATLPGDPTPPQAHPFRASTMSATGGHAVQGRYHGTLSYRRGELILRVSAPSVRVGPLGEPVLLESVSLDLATPAGTGFELARRGTPYRLGRRLEPRSTVTLGAIELRIRGVSASELSRARPVVTHRLLHRDEIGRAFRVPGRAYVPGPPGALDPVLAEVTRATRTPAAATGTEH